MVSPASVRPSPSTSTGAPAVFTRVSVAVGSVVVRVPEAGEATSAPGRVGAGRDRAAAHAAGVDVGLRDGVAGRAGRVRPGGQRGRRADDRADLGVVDHEVRHGDGTRVGDAEGVADPVTGVDPAVRVQVGRGAGGLDQGELGGRRGRGAGGVGARRDPRAAGGRAARRGAVVHGPGVGVGLGDRVGRRAGGLHPRRAAWSTGQLAVPAIKLSVMETPVRVTAPVLTTTKE